MERKCLGGVMGVYVVPRVDGTGAARRDGEERSV